MLLVFRFIALAASGIGLQMVRGLGLVAFALAALIGWRGLSPVWLTPLILSFALASHYLFEHTTGSGKALSALGNFPFEVIVFILIALAGYFFGKLLRRHIPI